MVQLLIEPLSRQDCVDPTVKCHVQHEVQYFLALTIVGTDKRGERNTLSHQEHVREFVRRNDLCLTWTDAIRVNKHCDWKGSCGREERIALTRIYAGILFGIS